MAKKSESSENGVATAAGGLSVFQVLEALQKVQRKDVIDTVTEYSKETQRIILPEGMSKKTASEELMNQYNNEEQTQNFTMQLEGWEWKDGLIAFKKVVEEKFGWVKGVQTWFSTPTEVDIVVDIVDGKQRSEKGYLGKVAFPTWENAQGSVAVNDVGQVGILITAKKKYSTAITEFYAEIRKFVKEHSIYRNRAIIISKGAKGLELTITELKPNPRIFLNYEEEMMIENFILDQLGEKDKRCFLFTGGYGNGKTETALRIGIEAIRKKVSFFYVKEASLFPQVLEFCKNYEPAIIFMEDVDEIGSGEQRDAKMNELLNTLDGVQTKGRGLFTIFTTNHEQRINAALRRPGRIDLIVKFGNPQRATVKKIYQSYFSDLNKAEEIDYEIVLPVTPDVPGAVVAEIAQRARKLAVKHGEISTEMVSAAASSMKHQIEFMNDDLEGTDEVKKAFETVRNFNQGNTEFTTAAK